MITARVLFSSIGYLPTDDAVAKAAKAKRGDRRDPAEYAEQGAIVELPRSEFERLEALGAVEKTKGDPSTPEAPGLPSEQAGAPGQPSDRGGAGGVSGDFTAPGIQPAGVAEAGKRGIPAQGEPAKGVDAPAETETPALPAASSSSGEEGALPALVDRSHADLDRLAAGATFPEGTKYRKSGNRAEKAADLQAAGLTDSTPNAG